MRPNRPASSTIPTSWNLSPPNLTSSLRSAWPSTAKAGCSSSSRTRINGRKTTRAPPAIASACSPIPMATAASTTGPPSPRASPNAMNVLVRADGAVYVVTRQDVATACAIRMATARPTKPRTILRLDTKDDYPHDGLESLTLKSDGHLLVAMGENHGMAFRLIGADDQSRHGRRRRRHDLSLLSGRRRSSSAGPSAFGIRSAFVKRPTTTSSLSTMIPMPARLADCSMSCPAATTVSAFAMADQAFIRSKPGTANYPAPCR